MRKKYLELALEAKENKITELNKDIETQKHNNYEIIKENQKVKSENADLRCENDDLRDILRQINKLMTCNTYNNETALRNKIIELSDTTSNQNR